jgi:ATP-dependent DNA helicase RecQ
VLSPDDIEETLSPWLQGLMQSILKVLLVTYNRLTIERLEQDNRKRYTVEDYQNLNRFYDNKAQQIHIVGEYARKMLVDYKDACSS